MKNHTARPARTGERPAGIRSALILGAGKVGSGLSRAIRGAGVSVTLRALRRGLPSRPIEADLIVLALRDCDLGPVAERMAAGRLVGHRAVAVVHCAGALGPEVLDPLRKAGALVAVAQMHPMISFASRAASPSLLRGHLHVDGDVAAVRAARALGRRLGMTPRTIRGLDRAAYHAAAGLVANGAAALAAAGLDLLEKAGIDRRTGANMLGPLLRSIAENVERFSMPQALTGPVRRGDAVGIARHLDALRRLAPHVVALYRACGLAQIPHARQLGEAEAGALDRIAELLQAHPSFEDRGSARANAPRMIRIKRAYDPPERADGLRFLVDRLWPRGMKKGELAMNAWLKAVAPSADLRRWFGHRVERWGDFRRRYRAELRSNPQTWQPIVEAAKHGVVTLLYSAHDIEHNGALVLRDFLAARLKANRPRKQANRARR